MPFKSEAQRRLFHAKAARGEISDATVKHWEEATSGKRLPEHVKTAMARLSPENMVPEALKTKEARTILKDFLAGVDPTGTKTFQYGIQDAPVSEGEAKARRTIGTVGGVVGGAGLIPAAAGGVIGGVNGLARGGLRGGARGFVQGAVSPYTSIYRGARAYGSLGRMGAGQAISKAEKANLVKMVGEVPGAGFVSKILGGLHRGAETASAAGKGLEGAAGAARGVAGSAAGAAKAVPQTQAALRQTAEGLSRIPAFSGSGAQRVIQGLESAAKGMDPAAASAAPWASLAEGIGGVARGAEEFGKLTGGISDRGLQWLSGQIGKPGLDVARREIRNKLIGGGAALGLSGGIGGASAYMQYGKGRRLGEALTPEQRAIAGGMKPSEAGGTGIQGMWQNPGQWQFGQGGYGGY